MNRRGFTLIELLIAMAIVAVLIALLLSAVHAVRAAADRTTCANRLRQLALAAQMFHDQHKQLPAGVDFQTGADHWQFTGWQVHLLPYLEQRALYDAAAEDYARAPNPFLRPVHAGHGHHLAEFTCPSDPRLREARYAPRHDLTAGLTSYLGVCGLDCINGNQGMLYRNSAIRFNQVSDGLSNTLLIGERPPGPDFSYGWWYAGIGQVTLGRQATGSAEMILGVREPNVTAITAGSPCGAGIYKFTAATLDDPCGVFHFWSVHSGGGQFAFADGSARFLRYAAEATLPALATRAGNDTPPAD